MIFFTADTHFSDTSTLMATGRPFKDVTEMNITLVDNWNKVVRPEDTVYILGDFGLFDYAKFLNGEKKLIKGNREYSTPDSKLKEHFDHVYTNEVVRINAENYTIYMTHKPICLPNKKLTEDTIQLFGHVHRTALYRPYGLNVGVDVHYYTPVSLDEVIQRCEFIRTYYDQAIFY